MGTTAHLRSSMISLGLLGFSVAALPVAAASCGKTNGTGLEVRVEYPLFEPEDRKLLVTVTGPASREAVVEAEQTLALAGIPAGRYTIAVVRPGFVLTTGGMKFTQTIAEGQCEQVTLALRGAQAISGTLFDNHAKPLAGVQIKLERAEDRLYATTNAAGKFSFRQVTPGPYWLATGSDGFAEQYYPVVADQDEASIIYVKPGEDVENLSFYVPAEARRRKVHVRVVRDDGTAAAGATVALRPAKGEDRKGVERAADNSGQAEFEAFADAAYVLIAVEGQGPVQRAVGMLEIPPGAAAVDGTVELQPGSPRTAER